MAMAALAFVSASLVCLGCGRRVHRSPLSELRDEDISGASNELAELLLALRPEAAFSPSHGHRKISVSSGMLRPRAREITASSSVDSEPVSSPSEEQDMQEKSDDSEPGLSKEQKLQMRIIEEKDKVKAAIKDKISDEEMSELMTKLEAVLNGAKLSPEEKMTVQERKRYERQQQEKMKQGFMDMTREAINKQLDKQNVTASDADIESVVSKVDIAEELAKLNEIVARSRETRNAPVPKKEKNPFDYDKIIEFVLFVLGVEGFGNAGQQWINSIYGTGMVETDPIDIVASAIFGAVGLYFYQKRAEKNEAKRKALREGGIAEDE